MVYTACIHTGKKIGLRGKVGGLDLLNKICASESLEELKINAGSVQDISECLSEFI